MPAMTGDVPVPTSVVGVIVIADALENNALSSPLVSHITDAWWEQRYTGGYDIRPHTPPSHLHRRTFKNRVSKLKENKKACPHFQSFSKTMDRPYIIFGNILTIFLSRCSTYFVHLRYAHQFQIGFFQDFKISCQ